MYERSLSTIWEWRQWRGWLRSALFALTLLGLAHTALAAQASFATPEEAVTALVQALRLNDTPRVNAVLGPGADALLRSGDSVQDKRRRASFLKAYDEAHRIVPEEDDRAVLHVGKEDWPMPIPMVAAQSRWRFDTRAGKQEILARRIGRNELAAIQVCLAIVDAEREYAAHDVNGDGILNYAPRIASTPGKRNGLYWETAPGDPPSPLGPFLAAAADRGYASTAPLAPYHGYYYRILSAQGKHAPRGARSYVVKGEMIGGFALIAYPARYGISGVMSFIVNQDGLLYQKDLGVDTARIARRMKDYDPDPTWKRP